MHGIAFALTTGGIVFGMKQVADSAIAINGSVLGIKQLAIGFGTGAAGGFMIATAEAAAVLAGAVGTVILQVAILKTEWDLFSSAMPATASKIGDLAKVLWSSFKLFVELARTGASAVGGVLTAAVDELLEKLGPLGSKLKLMLTYVDGLAAGFMAMFGDGAGASRNLDAKTRELAISRESGAVSAAGGLFFDKILKPIGNVGDFAANAMRSIGAPSYVPAPIPTRGPERLPGSKTINVVNHNTIDSRTRLKELIDETINADLRLANEAI